MRNMIKHLWIISLALALCLVQSGCAGNSSAKPTVTINRLTTRPSPATLPAGAKTIVAKNLYLNKYNRELDGQWQGVGVASDGNCYWSSCTHSPNSAAIFGKYDPRSGKLQVLCPDLSKLCGEDITKVPPQGKIHNDLVEANGWLYFATHTANYWPEALAKYTGSHAMGYELKTGKFRDFGIIKPNYTNYCAVGVSPEHNVLWVFGVTAAEPPADVIAASKEARENNQPDPALNYGDCRMFKIDLATGEITDTGVLARGSMRYNFCFCCFVDREGNCWLHLGSQPGCLTRVSLDGRIDRYEGILPLITTEDGRPDPDPKVQSRRNFGWMIVPLDRDRFLFDMNGELWTFDTSKPVGPEAFTHVRHIGGISVRAIAGDTIYFPRYVKGEKRYHLMSASLSNAQQPVVDHGIMVDKKGRIPTELIAMAADKDNVYFVGNWKILPGEKGTLKHDRKIREHENRDVFTELDTAQYFSVIPVAAAK